MDEQINNGQNIPNMPKRRGRPPKAIADVRDVHIDSVDRLSNTLNLAFNKYKTVANEEYIEINSNIDTLQNVVSEYLTDFMIVGHTLLGQRVVIRFAKNSKDYDALADLTKKTIIKMFIEEQQQGN
jgi:hypothetical protein